ncbi:MAG TPA: folate-binding protein YgfZ [Rhodocyclaceae bacterium]|nr:folate-binding protein YgfZ [Rhodocyclaceae bacterium]
MNTTWLEFLAAAGAGENLESFGDSAAETAAAAQGTVITPLVDLGVIRAGGEEAASFLHNLLTNDVNGLAADAWRRAGFCTPKGRLLADFRIWHEGSDLLLALSADIHVAMLKKLSMYVLRAKVKLSDATAERPLIGLAGPDAAARLAELGAAVPAAGGSVAFAAGTVLGLGNDRYLLSLQGGQAQAIWQQLSTKAKPVGLAAWRSLDVAAGDPRIVAATQEQFIPQMINYVQVGGLSFKKGCYPGQEIVARTQYLGKVKRHMVRARLDGAAAPGDAIYAPETGEQACGNVAVAAPSPQGGTEVLVVAQSSCTAAGELHLGSLTGPTLALLSLPYTVE